MISTTPIAGKLNFASAPPGMAAATPKEAGEPAMPTETVDLSGGSSRSSTFVKTAAVVGLGLVALGVGAAPAQAHDVGCGWSTSQTTQYDNYGNVLMQQENFNSCDGEHVVTQNGYLVHHDYHGVQHQHGHGHRDHGYRNHGHRDHGYDHGHGHHSDSDGAAEFLFGLGLGIILSQ